jgi:hypothetical protein
MPGQEFMQTFAQGNSNAYGRAEEWERKAIEQSSPEELLRRAIYSTREYADGMQVMIDRGIMYSRDTRAEFMRLVCAAAEKTLPPG